MLCGRSSTWAIKTEMDPQLHQPNSRQVVQSVKQAGQGTIIQQKQLSFVLHTAGCEYVIFFLFSHFSPRLSTCALKICRPSGVLSWSEFSQTSGRPRLAVPVHKPRRSRGSPGEF